MRIVLYLLPFLFAFSAHSQTPSDETKATLTKIIDHVEDASLYRNQVDWDTLKPQVYTLAKDATTTEALAPAINYLLRAIGDEHGRVFHQNKILAFYNAPLKDHQSAFHPETYNHIQNGQTYPFRAELLQPTIAYIRIVGLPMGDNAAMTKAIQDRVCELHAQGAKQWIVDLRYNGGGNMFPMIEGITTIIGEGAVGGAKGLTENEDAVWRIENGHFYYDHTSVQYQNDCSIQHLPQVAILTSLYTASSGEAIAVIFKGRANTSFFGEKTLGMVTVTDWTVIDDSTAMTISVSYYKDRNGKVYDQYVDVDKEIVFQPEEDLEKDTGVLKAVEWLKGKK